LLRTLVFFYPQLKKLTGAERLILKLAGYAGRRTTATGYELRATSYAARSPQPDNHSVLSPQSSVLRPLLLTHRFAEECRAALGEGVRLVETGWRMRWTGNHYLDAAIEYALGPALATRIPREGLGGVVFFGPPSVPAMFFTRQVLFRLWRKKVPVLYFCYEPPRFIYSDTNDILARIPIPSAVLRPLLALYRRLDRLMVGAAHRVLSNSPYGSRRIHRAYGRRATVIPHGVDFTAPSPQAVAEVRERYGLGERPVAVTVNHLHPRKRIDLFLKAVAEARKSVPDAVGLVVGEGPERERLHVLAHALGLEPGCDVIFAGAVSEEELPAHYAASNVYAHTGREESFGLSVIEALALGLPVVSVDEGGPRDTVQDGVSGYLVQPEPEVLGEAIARLLSSPQEAREMGRRGADFIRSNYSWELGAETLLRVLGEVEGKLRAGAQSSLASQSKKNG
jgi:glycosyltransferase involved in cell wall biosynthesis